MAFLLGNPELLFHLIAGVVLLAAGVVVAAVNGRVGVTLLLFVGAASWYLRTPLLTWTTPAGGLIITPADVTAAVLAGAAVVRILFGHAARGRGYLWLLTAVLALNVARGAALYGTPVALNEARGWTYLLAAGLYAATLPVATPRWWARALTSVCLWLGAVALVGYARTGLEPVQVRVNLAGELVDPRPVTAAGAALIAATVLLSTRWVHGRAVRRCGWLLFAVLLVTLQHRTVWVAAAAAGCYLLATALRAGGRRQLSAVLTVAAGAVIVPALVSSRLAAESAVAQSAADDDTFLWRLDGWGQLLHQSTAPQDVLLGRPFGSGFDRVIRGFEVAVSPHSQYVETYLRFGVVGCVALVLLLVAAWRSAGVAAAAFGVSPQVVRAVLLFVAAYGVTYRWDPFQLAVLGTVLGVAALPRTAPANPGPVPSDVIGRAVTVG